MGGVDARAASGSAQNDGDWFWNGGQRTSDGPAMGSCFGERQIRASVWRQPSGAWPGGNGALSDCRLSEICGASCESRDASSGVIETGHFQEAASSGERGLCDGLGGAAARVGERRGADACGVKYNELFCGVAGAGARFWAGGGNECGRG